MESCQIEEAVLSLFHPVLFHRYSMLSHIDTQICCTKVKKSSCGKQKIEISGPIFAPLEIKATTLPSLKIIIIFPLIDICVPVDKENIYVYINLHSKQY